MKQFEKKFEKWCQECEVKGFFVCVLKQECDIRCVLGEAVGQLCAGWAKTKENRPLMRVADKQNICNSLFKR